MRTPHQKKRLFWAVAGVVLLELLLLALCVWQYTRWQEKLVMQAHWQARLANPPTTLSGTFDNTRSTLLEAQDSKEGEEGYRLVTPLVTAPGHETLVDRGWIPHDFTPGFLNRYATTGQVTVRGIEKPFPVRHGWLKGPTLGVGAPGTTVLLFFDPAHIPDPARNIRPAYYLQATVPTTGGIEAFAPQPYGLPPAQHFQYMLTWLLLALILAGLALRAAWQNCHGPRA